MAGKKKKRDKKRVSVRAEEFCYLKRQQWEVLVGMYKARGIGSMYQGRRKPRNRTILQALVTEKEFIEQLTVTPGLDYLAGGYDDYSGPLNFSWKNVVNTLEKRGYLARFTPEGYKERVVVPLSLSRNQKNERE